MIMSNGKLIAVWGSKDCGKTTLAVKLASKLAAMKRETILIHTDLLAPDINVLMPEKKDINTMGNLWAMPDCSIDTIFKACNVTDSKHLAVLSFRSGDNIFTFPEYTKENIMEIFMKLKNLAEYIIVDCVEAFAWNSITTVSLELADKVIRLGEPTMKSFSFYDSNLALLHDSRYRTDQHFKVLAKVKSNQAKEIAISHFGGINVELPFVGELEKQMLEGELFQLTDNKEMKSYNAGIDNILDVVFFEKKIEDNENIALTKLEKKARKVQKPDSDKNSSTKAAANLKSVRSAFKSRKNKEAS